MAITKFTNDEQRNAYMALARINNSFRNIVSVLDDMTHGIIFENELSEERPAFGENRKPRKWK